MKTLEQQGVSIIKQVSTVLSAKYGFIIDADYSDSLTDLLSEDKTELIRLTCIDEQISHRVSLYYRDDERAAELTKTITDVIDVVMILNDVPN